MLIKLIRARDELYDEIPPLTWRKNEMGERA